MTKHPVILVIFLFALHAFASPWRPFGIFKRALREENQNDRRGGNFYTVYGDWPPNSEIHRSQLSSWNTPSVTTTEESLETSTVFPQYSWKTTTAQASTITSPKISTSHETTKKHKASTVNGTHHQETCSVVPTSTIYETVFSTVHRQTVLSTMTEIQTQTLAGSTVTQQVPTTILSIVASQGSCTPAGPVIPPTTVTQKETTTIFSTIAGPTIGSTQIVSATGQITVLTQTQYSTLVVPAVTQAVVSTKYQISTVVGPTITRTEYSTVQGPGETETVVSTQYQVSTVRSVYTETEWSAATATVKSTYTETETVTQTVVSTLSVATQVVTCKSLASKLRSPT